MDKDPMIELSEFHNNLYGSISDSRENLIEVSINLLHFFFYTILSKIFIIYYNIILIH